MRVGKSWRAMPHHSPYDRLATPSPNTATCHSVPEDPRLTRTPSPSPDRHGLALNVAILNCCASVVVYYCSWIYLIASAPVQPPFESIYVEEAPNQTKRWLIYWWSIHRKKTKLSQEKKKRHIPLFQFHQVDSKWTDTEYAKFWILRNEPLPSLPAINGICNDKIKSKVEVNLIDLPNNDYCDYDYDPAVAANVRRL